MEAAKKLPAASQGECENPVAAVLEVTAAVVGTRTSRTGRRCHCRWTVLGGWSRTWTVSCSTAERPHQPLNPTLAGSLPPLDRLQVYLLKKVEDAISSVDAGSIFGFNTSSPQQLKKKAPLRRPKSALAASLRNSVPRKSQGAAGLGSLTRSREADPFGSLSRGSRGSSVFERVSEGGSPSLGQKEEEQTPDWPRLEETPDTPTVGRIHEEEADFWGAMSRGAASTLSSPSSPPGGEETQLGTGLAWSDLQKEAKEEEEAPPEAPPQSHPNHHPNPL